MYPGGVTAVGLLPSASITNNVPTLGGADVARFSLEGQLGSVGRIGGRLDRTLQQSNEPPPSDARIE